MGQYVVEVIVKGGIGARNFGLGALDYGCFGTHLAHGKVGGIVIFLTIFGCLFFPISCHEHYRV